MSARRRGWLVAIAAVAAIVAVGGTAQAFWSAPGAGTGSSTTSQAIAVELTAGTATGSLRPGGSAEVRTTAINPGGATVRLPSLQLDTTRGEGGFAATNGCPASAFSFAPGTTGWSLPTQSSTEIVLPGAVTMSANAPSSCQGATVTVYLRVGA